MTKLFKFIVSNRKFKFCLSKLPELLEIQRLVENVQLIIKSLIKSHRVDLSFSGKILVENSYQNHKKLIENVNLSLSLFLQLRKQMNVAKDSKIRPFYEKAPFFVDFRIYVFNVTNKDEVIRGSM